MFSLVMPTCNDFDGVAFSLKAAQIMHSDYINDFVVVDNCPSLQVAKTTENFVISAGGRYIPYTERKGTAAAKNEAIRNAKNDWVICIDSHVLLYDVSTLAEFLKYKFKFSDEKDKKVSNDRFIIHGPIMQDTGEVMATHFDPLWRGEMFGVWARNDSDKPFEIPGMGMGAFVVNKRFWMGFHPEFEGFGGEEMYIHEKYRQAGGKAVCVPQFKWWHRFARPNGMPYHHTVDEKVVNYVIGWRDLGWDLKPIHDAFVSTGLMGIERYNQILGGWRMSKDAAATFNTIVPPSDCTPCGGKKLTYEELINIPSDINEHLPTLMQLAKNCKVVVDCGSGDATTLAFHAGGNPTITVHAARGTNNSMETALVDCDLLFLDTDPHDFTHVIAELNRWASHAKRYIVLHDTQIYGEKYGESPGILPAVREFQSNNPQWVTVAHYDNNHGLTVLSCNPIDYPPELPHIAKRGLRFGIAKAKDLLNGGKRVTLQIAQERQSICNSNGGRCPAGMHRIDGNTCAKCGCELASKVTYPLEACPLGYWMPSEEVEA